MNTWRVILATMVIFGAGVLTGGLLVRHSEHIKLPRSSRVSAASRPTQVQPISAGGLRLDFLRRAGRELGLTPEQKESVDKIIKESQDRTRKVMSPYLREEIQRAKDEFREVLTPEQRARFDEVLKQQQQRAREQHRPKAPGQGTAESAPAEPKK